VTRYDPAEYYHDGGTMRRVSPEVPTGICGVCGERYKTRADGTVRMHSRARRDGEAIAAAYWCDGGLPAGAR
jgi:hypothetical protein